MKKCFFIILLFSFTCTEMVTAQQTPVKKTVPKKIQPPKIINVPPPPKVEKPIIVETSPVPSYQQPALPMVMESSEATKFRKERICADCDTLKLDANKPHIIIYDVKWMSNNESRTYRPQPTENDLSKDYYALRGENKREWEELKKNFPENEFNYHHVYRNTYIQIANKKQQTLSLLDRQERHEGFLYWSGKANDSTVNRKKMVLLTETVAKEIGENKISSYYENFLKDSLTIASYQKTVNPSINLMANMNVLLQKELFGETVIPFQFLDLNKVSKIITQSESEKDKHISFTLNNRGQLTKIAEGRRDSTIISYKDNLPSIVKEGSQIINFYYQADTVIIKESNTLQVYKLVGKVFLEIDKYNISEDDYAKMTLTDGYQIKFTNTNTNTCITKTEKDELKSNKICYSNTNWELPLNLTVKDVSDNYTFESKISYSKNADNNLVVEDLNNAKSTRLIYEIVDGKATKITHFSKRGQGEFVEPYILNVRYEYFK